MKSRRASLRMKLAVSFVAVAILFLIAVAVGALRISGVASNVQTSYGKAAMANEASAGAFNMRVSQAQDALAGKFILNPDGSVMHPGDVTNFAHTLAGLRASASTPTDRSSLRRIAAIFASWKQGDVKSATLWRSGNQRASTAWELGEENDRGDALSNALFNYATALQKQADTAKASSVSQSQMIMGLVSGLALVIACVIAFVLSRSISRRLGALVQRLQSLSVNCLASLSSGLAAVSTGNLTVDAESTTAPVGDAGGDEIGQLSGTFNQMLKQIAESIGNYNTMRAQLADLVSEISESSTVVASASHEMAATSEEAGRAVGEIARAVSDVAAGAERQVGMVTRAQESTHETRKAAEGAASVAQEGVAAADQANDAMLALRASTNEVMSAIRALSAKSDQIGGIVETITGIAAQTNLLALNAAIEAARAGEQGRGFAVVAEEVRKLAEESQAAAGTIGDLITQIQAETARTVQIVEDGAERTEKSSATVEAAQESFRQIGASVEDICTRIEQIVEATGEVAAVAEESSASTEEVSAATQQTSASTEEIAASAQILARTAEQLNQIVGQFQIARG